MVNSLGKPRLSIMDNKYEKLNIYLIISILRDVRRFV